jgi:hypothetical protein
MADGASLTICMVTRGRREHLQEALQGLSSLKLTPNDRILVINNGADEFSTKILNDFVNEKPLERRQVRIEVNDARPSVFWDFVAECKSDWVVFPSDDDIMLSNAIDTWRRCLSRKPDALAFCGSAAVIDVKSKRTGITLKPEIHNFPEESRSLANAFFQPPFIWPALFFKKEFIDLNSCQSRYAFDWWIGISLIAQGKILTTSEEILLYRNHDQQESNLATSSRKYFEAMVWLGRFCRSELFKKWVADQDEDSLLEFWAHIKKYGPVYGDERFGSFVLYQIAEELIAHSSSRIFAASVASDIAFLNHVYFKPNESWHISTKREQVSWPGNVGLVSGTNLCRKILEIAEVINSSNSANLISICCMHSKSKFEGILVNCELLTSEKLEIKVDMLLSHISSKLDASDGSRAVLSPGEMLAIRIIRALMNKLPAPGRNFLKQLKARVVKR